MVDAREPRPSGSGPEALPLPHGRGSGLAGLLRWAPALAWMALIFWLSSQPQLPRLPEPLWQTLLAKTAHLGEYAVLAGLLLFALRERRVARSPRPKGMLPGSYLLVVAIAIAYAASDEFHQSFVPNRTASGWDVLIDTAGVLVALRVSGGSRGARRAHLGRARGSRSLP